jgi:hypothetical protein
VSGRRYDAAEMRRTLDASKVMYEVFNGGMHLKIRHGGRVIDFWPTTGKWSGDGKKGTEPRTLFEMLKVAKGEPPPVDLPRPPARVSAFARGPEPEGPPDEYRFPKAQRPYTSEVKDDGGPAEESSTPSEELVP